MPSIPPTESVEGNPAAVSRSSSPRTSSAGGVDPRTLSRETSYGVASSASSKGSQLGSLSFTAAPSRLTSSRRTRSRCLALYDSCSASHLSRQARQNSPAPQYAFFSNSLSGRESG
eukprot:1178707-Prorocentrum_minimum.AAC.8